MFRVLFSLFRDLLTGQLAERRVIVESSDEAAVSRQYSIRPKSVRRVLLSTLVIYTVIIAVLASMTPLGRLLPGYVTPELERTARLIALRIESLEDSLAAQEMYLSNLRNIFTSEVDPSLAEPDLAAVSDFDPGRFESSVTLTRPEDWEDHMHPALPVSVMPANLTTPSLSEPVPNPYLAGLQLPSLAPVDGIVTNHFDAQTGHFAIDIATEAGTTVRSIGDGYVVFSDWTYTGGHTIIVQHANGYLSVYKHNQQLLKRVADRVSVREGLAISGNSGEYTTGPHLHFELWNNGLAQDPSAYILGL